MFTKCLAHLIIQLAFIISASYQCMLKFESFYFLLEKYLLIEHKSLFGRYATEVILSRYLVWSASQPLSCLLKRMVQCIALA